LPSNQASQPIAIKKIAAVDKVHLALNGQDYQQGG
jgi:hypothetical protein